MALRARIYAYNRHLPFDVAFICSTLTHCGAHGVCDLSVWRLKWEVSYVRQSVWRWKWFSCQSSYVLQRLRLCRTSDTVFRREIDSRRQWGYGTCYGVVIVSPLRRSVGVIMPLLNSYSASHDNWCTATLWNRIMTAQCEGMGEVGSARYEPALLPPCPSIRVLSYSNCQEINSRQQTGLTVQVLIQDFYIFFFSIFFLLTSAISFATLLKQLMWNLHNQKLSKHQSTTVLVLPLRFQIFPPTFAISFVTLLKDWAYVEFASSRFLRISSATGESSCWLMECSLWSRLRHRATSSRGPGNSPATLFSSDTGACFSTPCNREKEYQYKLYMRGNMDSNTKKREREKKRKTKRGKNSNRISLVKVQHIWNCHYKSNCIVYLNLKTIFVHYNPFGLTAGDLSTMQFWLAA